MMMKQFDYHRQTLEEMHDGPEVLKRAVRRGHCGKASCVKKVIACKAKTSSNARKRYQRRKSERKTMKNVLCANAFQSSSASLSGAAEAACKTRLC